MWSKYEVARWMRRQTRPRDDDPPPTRLGNLVGAIIFSGLLYILIRLVFG